jgi:hypothetical protein
MIFQTILILILLWVIFAIIFPFILFPNYFLSYKIDNSINIRNKSTSLKSKSKRKTITNIYNYIIKTYKGNKNQYKFSNFPIFFQYKSSVLLDKKQFLWCHTQNNILRDLLVSTNKFSKKDIKIKWTLSKNFTTHQYILIHFDNLECKLDPFYKIITFKKLLKP